MNPKDHQMSTILALFIRRAKNQTTTIMAIAKAVPEISSRKYSQNGRSTKAASLTPPGVLETCQFFFSPIFIAHARGISETSGLQSLFFNALCAENGELGGMSRFDHHICGELQWPFAKVENDLFDGQLAFKK